MHSRCARNVIIYLVFISKRKNKTQKKVFKDKIHNVFYELEIELTLNILKGFSLLPLYEF